MADRPLEIFDEFSKHLRFLQFTLVASCIAFVTILLSDRQSTIALADKQINEIYSYTLSANWNENGIQKYLDAEAQSQTLSISSIQFAQAKNQTYSLKDSINENAEFDFLFRFRYFKDLVSQNEINFDGNIRRPKTLEEFKQFFNALTTPDGVYVIEGIESPIKLVEGYRHNNPYDESENESKIPLDRFSISPRNQLENTTELSDRTYEALMENPCNLVLNWTDGYSDNLGNINEDYSQYTISFDVRRERYRPMEFILECSAFQAAKNWEYTSFEEQFKALNVITKGWDDINIVAAKKIINSEYARAGDTFEIVGVELPAQGLLLWGIFLILGIQLFFYLHLREFFKRHILFEAVQLPVTKPWLLLYHGFWPLAIFYGTVIFLPIITAIVVIVINASIYPLDEVNRYLHVILAGFAVVVLAILSGIQHHKLGLVLIRD